MKRRWCARCVCSVAGWWCASPGHRRCRRFPKKIRFNSLATWRKRWSSAPVTGCMTPAAAIGVRRVAPTAYHSRCWSLAWVSSAAVNWISPPISIWFLPGRSTAAPKGGVVNWIMPSSLPAWGSGWSKCSINPRRTVLSTVWICGCARSATAARWCWALRRWKIITRSRGATGSAMRWSKRESWAMTTVFTPASYVRCCGPLSSVAISTSAWSSLCATWKGWSPAKCVAVAWKTTSS